MKRLALVAIALLATLSLGGATTRADKPVTKFDVHVGDAFILGTFGQAATDIAGAENGDTIELLFTGRIDTRRSQAEATAVSGISTKAASYWILVFLRLSV